MPMGNGKLFLPVKAEIRKIIGKQEGDYVKVVLFADNDRIEIPEDLLQCLKEDPVAYQVFLNYPEGKQKLMIDRINSAKKSETRVERIAQALNSLVHGQKKR